MAQTAVSFNDVFEDGDVDGPKNIQHIRANSSIMKLNKLMGEPIFQGEPDASCDCLLSGIVCLQLAIALLFCSTRSANV